MPFCLECEAEYEAGIETCTDCGVALVDSLPIEEEPPDLDTAELIPMQSFANAAQASLVMNLLQENGLRALVSGGEFTVAPSAFSEEIVLLVDERDLEKAQTLYDAYFGANTAGDFDVPQEEAPTNPSEETEDGQS